MQKPRIMLALMIKLECKQNEAKVKRIKKSIEVATINAEEKIAKADDTLNKLLNDFDVDSDAGDLISSISEAFTEKDDAQAEIEQLKRIEKYLFEELDEPEEKTSKIN